MSDNFLLEEVSHNHSRRFWRVASLFGRVFWFLLVFAILRYAAGLAHDAAFICAWISMEASGSDALNLHLAVDLARAIGVTPEDK